MNRLARYGLLPVLSLVTLFFASARVCANETLTNCTESALSAALPGGGVISLSCNGTIRLTNTVVISTNVTLDASGHAVTLSGGDSVRLFHVKTGVRFVLKNVSLTNGRDGDNSTNAIPGRQGRGGAILNEGGVVVLIGSTLSGHRVLGSKGAGGLAVTAGNGEGGDDGGSGSGGAIYNDGGVVFATNSVFFANSAAGGEGGNGSAGAATGNGGTGGDGGNGGVGSGGAIFNTRSGIIEIYDSSFTSNRVAGAAGGLSALGGGGLGLDGEDGQGGSGLGGGIYNDGGTVLIRNSTFAQNSCVGVTGNEGLAGPGNRNGSPGSSGSNAQGAALFNSGGAAALTNSTIFGNVVVGGFGGKGGAGGTLGFGGDGGRGGAGGEATGAGVYNTANGMMTIVNCTIANNSARAGKEGAGGAPGSSTSRAGRSGTPGLSLGCGVYSLHGSLLLRNTILSKNSEGGNCGGIISDDGNNLSSDSSCLFTQSTSRSQTDAGLGPLADNGGRTQTLALSTNSPAIDAGSDLGCPATDQRHASRVGPCDIGAFEFNGTLPDLILQASRLQRNSLVLTWPVSSLGLVLQTTSSLTTPIFWNSVTNTITTTNDFNSVTITPADGNQFFRLRQP